jgi:hypothetical protein
MTEGITQNTIRTRIDLDRDEAEALGAYLSVERATTTTTHGIGTYPVDGRTNGVIYGNQNTSDVPRSMAGQIDMVPGNIYEINAAGIIDKGDGIVRPTDSQYGRDGTRLQVAVTEGDKVINHFDYEPGMKLTTEHSGRKLGFYFADGDLRDNSGQFDVRVRETGVSRSETNIAAIESDPLEFRRTIDSTTDYASIPAPDRALAGLSAGRGIAVDRDNGIVATPDGYRFEMGDNKLNIYLPGQDDPATTFDGRNVIERDGTKWTAETGNYFMPNGAMFRLEYDGDKMKSFELANGDSHVAAWDLNRKDVPTIGRVKDGGYEWRRQQVEAHVGDRSYRLGGYNDGLDDRDITWNMERDGKNIGVMDRDTVVNEAYHVDPSLRGEPGTEQYVRMLRSAIEDQRSTIAGDEEKEGYSRKTAEAIADYILGSNGQYDRYAKAMLANAPSSMLDRAGTSAGSSSSGRSEDLAALVPIIAGLMRSQQAQAPRDAGQLQALQGLAQNPAAVHQLLERPEIQSWIRSGGLQGVLQGPAGPAIMRWLAQNPAIVQEMLRSPAVQSWLQNGGLQALQKSGVLTPDVMRGLQQQMWMQRLLGGMPGNGAGFDSSMDSLAALQQIIGSQGDIAGDYAAQRAAAAGLDPRAFGRQQRQIDPEALAAALGIDPSVLESLGLDRRTLNSRGIPQELFDDDTLRMLRRYGFTPDSLSDAQLLYLLSQRESAFDDNPQGAQVLANALKGAALARYGGPALRGAAARAGAAGSAARAAAGRYGEQAALRGRNALNAGKGLINRLTGRGLSAAESKTGEQFAAWMAGKEFKSAEEAVAAYTKYLGTGGDVAPLTEGEVAACARAFDKAPKAAADAAKGTLKGAAATSDPTAKAFGEWLKRQGEGAFKSSDKAIGAYEKFIGDAVKFSPGERAACEAVFRAQTGAAQGVVAGTAQQTGKAIADKATQEGGKKGAEELAKNLVKEGAEEGAKQTAKSTLRTIAHGAGWAAGGLIDAYFINEGAKEDAARGDGVHIERNKAIGAAIGGTAVAVGVAMCWNPVGWGILGAAGLAAAGSMIGGWLAGAATDKTPKH